MIPTLKILTKKKNDNNYFQLITKSKKRDCINLKKERLFSKYKMKGMLQFQKAMKQPREQK